MLFWEKVVMSFEKHIKPVLIAVGVAFLVWGLFIAVMYTFRMNSDRDWGQTQLMYDLGFIVMGVAFEILGLGFVVLGKK